MVVNINFEVEGKEATYKKAITKFIYNKDTVNVNIENGKLSIPTTLAKKNATLIFCIDKYVLKFISIPVTWNDLNPNWTIGVDTSPFDKEKFWTVKSWNKVEIVYYLKNEDGRMFTVDDCKKSVVIKSKAL